MNETVIVVDGACSGNPGKGGWAALVRRGAQEIITTGKSPETTNNQMELSAVIGGLEMLRQGEKATLYSDSKYVVEGITKWIFKWKKSNWLTATGERVKNRGLWERLSQLTKSGDVKILWIRGHSNDDMDTVDRLAKQQTFL
jgi:ribonuclease HI